MVNIFLLMFFWGVTVVSMCLSSLLFSFIIFYIFSEVFVMMLLLQSKSVRNNNHVVLFLFLNSVLPLIMMVLGGLSGSGAVISLGVLFKLAMIPLPGLVGDLVKELGKMEFSFLMGLSKMPFFVLLSKFNFDVESFWFLGVMMVVVLSGVVLGGSMKIQKILFITSSLKTLMFLFLWQTTGDTWALLAYWVLYSLTLITAVLKKVDCSSESTQTMVALMGFPPFFVFLLKYWVMVLSGNMFSGYGGVVLVGLMLVWLMGVAGVVYALLVPSLSMEESNKHMGLYFFFMVSLGVWFL